MTRWCALLLALMLLAGCGGSPTPTPDLVATQIAVEEAAHATMTARAPTPTDTPVPTEIPSATPTSTSTHTPSPSPTSTPTETQSPTPTLTPSATPTQTPSPEPTLTATPEAKHTQVPTVKPTATAQAASLDQYKVYYSQFDGTTIADNEHTVNYGLWSMRGDGQEPAMLFSEAQQPDLSMEANKLAYVHLASGIFVYDMTTGENRHVINHTSALSPSFSPGGHRIAYAEYTVVQWWQLFTANSRLHIADVDGSNDVDITVGRRPAWSPTSNLILYEACERTTCGIMVLNADTSHSRLVVGRSAGKGSWSPDGQTITYSTDEDGDSEIWAISVDGTGDRKLTDNPNTDALAAWSPDGKYIYYLSDREGGWGIWIMRPDGSGQRKIRSIGVPQYWQWAKMAVGWNK